MEIVKAATIWTKAEIVSSMWFMFFGVVNILVAIGFWKFGNVEILKALILPLLIVGGLLLGAGISFYLSNSSRLSNIEKDYHNDISAWINSEFEKTESTIRTYENVALKIFPGIILVALLIIVFVAHIKVRAICIAIMVFLLTLVLLDSRALKRIKTYHKQLELVQLDLLKK